MKTSLLSPPLRHAILWTSLWFAGWLVSTVTPAHASLSLELNVIRYDQGGYYFSPNLTTNDAPPILAYGDYYIASSGQPNGGSGAQYHFDAGGFHQSGGGSWGYGSFDEMRLQLTNALWTLAITNQTLTNVYTFTVTANIDSNSLPAVTILNPPDGAVNVPSQPGYLWLGPANYANLIVYTYNDSETLDVTQTNWTSPNLLPQGLNNFTVHYDDYPTNGVVASVPLDAALQPLDGWVSTTHLQNYRGSQFTVGIADTAGTSHTLVAHFAWDGTNVDGSASGTDTSGNGYNLNFGGSFGGQGGVNSTTEGRAGAGAIQFHNGDGNSAGYVGWDPMPAGLLTALSGSFSVSCWIKTTQNFAWDQAPAYYGAGIISADNEGQGNDLIPLALTGSKIGFNTGGDYGDDTINSSASINDGNYHHMVVTRNQATGQKLIYIDGVLDGFSSGTLNSLNDPQKLTIGALADAGNPHPDDGSYYNGFDGDVDDLQIYSGVLSAGEVGNLYANPGSTALNGGGLIGGHRNVAHYTFDDSGNLGQDSSGNGNDMNSETWWGPQHEFATDAEAGGGAIQFFGTDAIAPNAQARANLNAVLTGSFTFSAWVKTTVTNGEDYNNAFFGGVIFWAYNDHGDTNDTIPLSITGSKAAFTTRDHLGDDNTLHSVTSVNDGNYHLITVTRDQTSGEKKIYVDGQFESSEIGTTDPLNGNNYNLTLGGWAYILESNATVTNYSSYRGLLDDAQIYSGVLSPDEVASLFANPGTVVPDVAGSAAGPLAHYDFDEGTALAPDVSGNNNNVIYAGNFGGSGPDTSSDARAGAGSVSFDGGSYLTATPNLLATLAGDFTVSLWLKTSQSYGNQGDLAWAGAGVVCADSPDSASRDLIPVALTGGQVAFNVGEGNGDDSTLNSSATVNDDGWHHIVVTRSQATGQRQIFIDGALDNSDTAITGLLNDPVLLTLGAKSDASDADPASPDDNGSNGYEGLLDDLQIYSRVLGAEEVAFLYQNPGGVISGSPFDAALNSTGLTWTTGGTTGWYVETTNTFDGVSAAQSGLLGDGQTNWIQTTVPSGGQLSFYWQVSSEQDWDYLTFYINGVEQDAISGEVVWNQENYAVQAGDVLRWEYTKDPDCCTNGMDAGFLDQVSYTPNGSINFNTALGTTGWNWSTSGDAGWFTENTLTHDDNYAAQSGSVTNGQISRLQTTITGPGTLGFWWTTLDDYSGFDLEFAMDGNYHDDISGYNGYWQQFSITIPPGSHTLSWTAYGGDSPTNSGFLDQVSFTSDYKPIISYGPVDGTLSNLVFNSTIPVLLGSNAVLVVQLAGKPAPDIRWYKNNALLTNANSATLVITNIQFADAGTYQLTASNYLGVSSSAYVTLRVYQRTDLQPLALTVPPVISSSSLAPITWTVTNSGPATVTQFYDSLDFAAPVVTPFYILNSLWAVYNNTPISPASTYTTTNTTHRFPSVPAGDYTLVLNVDAYNYITETNENNNALTNLPITVINPDMQPGNLQVASVNTLGQSSLQFTYNLTNNGPGILDGANFYDELFLSTNATLDDSAIAIKQVNQSPTIAPGGYFSTTNFFTVPIVPSGDYYLILHVDHYGYQGVGNIWEVSETNNYAVTQVHILQSDLVPTNLVAPALVSSRQTLPVSWNDFNQGAGLATNLTYFLLFDNLYLSTNQSVNASSIKLGNYYYSDFNGYQYYQSQDFYWNTGIAPGQSLTNLQNLVIPNVAAGNYYLVLSVDANNAIREINETNNALVVPITLGSLDLMPVAFSTPPSANTRSAITVSWAVTNTGTGTVYPQWVDRVFISTNSVYDSHATLLGEFARTNALGAAANYAVTNTIALTGIGAGGYYLLLLADAGNNVVELSDSNNFVATPIIINSPDLVAESLTVGASFSSQQPMSAVFSITNVSGITAYTGWSDRLFLSPNGILETNNIPLTADILHGADLAGGEGYSQLANSAIPAVPAGDYFVLLQANANGFFAENNTANNLLAKPVHINNPDLALTNFAAPSSITLTQYNQQFEADWSVLNQGAGDAYASWGDYLYISRTNVLDANAVFIGYANQNPVLGAGQSYLAFANAALPNGIQGSYYLLLSANASRSLYESTYTNNLVARPVNLVVPPVPVLSVTSVDSPADAWSGQQIYVTWSLTNAGTAPVSGSFYDVVYLCSSAAGANPQVYGSFEFSGEILPGQSIVRQQKISLPISLQGTFWVALQTDVSHNIFEFTYRTNDFLVASHPLVVHLTPTPNLQIASIVAPTNMYSGGEGTVSWIVTNRGAGPTSASFWDDSVYLCDGTNFNTASYRYYLGAPNNVAYLNPADSYASSANIMLPRGITGTFYFIVTADAGNNVFEGTDENDNRLTSAPIFVAPATTPDLQTVTVQPPQNAFSGTTISLKYAVTNFGLGQTQPSEIQWSDRVYMSSNNILDSTAIYLGDIGHNGGLTPEDGYVMTNASVKLPVGVSGDYYFIVTADIFNQVYEAAFEGNNARTAAYVTHIALTPPPDLETVVVQAPANLAASHTLNVTYTVFNNGITITPNTGWYDSLYFWTNSVFDGAHATYLGLVPHNGALSPGTGYTNTFSVVLPDGLTGTNYIFVQSDPNNSVFELNKTNNLAAATNPVVIQFVPADLAVTRLITPATCNAGSAILVNWAVTNRGPGDTAVATWSDRLILSQNILPGAPSDVSLLSLGHTGLLGTNGAYAVSNVLAQVPTYVAPGNYQLFLVADVNNQIPVETNRANNVYGPVPITITAHSPDLQVATASAPTNALSGSTVVVTWTVANAGDLPANFTYWYDAVYLSTDGLVGPNTKLLGYQRNPGSLPSGASYTNGITVTLPVNVSSNYYFVVVADAFNYLTEAGAENNNGFIITPPVFITLSPVPDLAVTSVITPATAYEGQNFHLSWMVKNVGTASATAAWADVAYLSVDQILDTSVDTYLGYTYKNYNLAPGESYTNSADLPIPQGLSGPFYVFVTADPGHALNERGLLTNNTAYNPQAMQVQLLPPVDLVAGQITIPVNATPGKSLTVSYTVQNEGANAALGSWVDTLFISSDTNWDVGDLQFARVTHNGDVPPGGSYTNVVTATVPGVVPGNYYLIVRSDILNHLAEANKSNNIAASLNSSALDVEQLVFGSPASDSLGLGQSAFYKFDATNGQTIHLQFTSSDSLAANELFVQFGQMPNAGSFAVADNEPFKASPGIYLAVTNTGTYYVLAKCDFATGPTPYTLLAEVLPFTVREVQPNMSGNVGTTTFFVRGALFGTNTQFALQQGSRLLDAQRVYVADSTAVYVTFNMNGTPDGEWDFLAVMTDTASNSVVTTLTNAVFVGSADPVDPDVAIDGPLAVREPGLGYATHSCLVDYGNSGYSDLAPPLILVQSRDGTTIGTERNNLTMKTIQLIGRSLVGPPDILRPQSQASKIIWFRGGGTHLEVWTLPADSTRPITETDWQGIENSVRPSGINDGDWLNFWVNIRPRIGNTWGDYVQFVGRIARDFPAEEREVSTMFLSLYTNAPGFRASAMVAGTLLGAADGLPQPNLEVDLITQNAEDADNFSGAVVARTQTDQAGNFTFSYVAPGQYYYGVPGQRIDMDRDGLMDTNLAGFLMTSTDLMNQVVYLNQAPPSSPPPVSDDTATLLLDGENVLHTLWYRNGSLWHAWNHNGQWIDAGVVCSNLIGSFAAGAGPHLLNGASAGLMLAWSESTSNNVQLFYRVGRRAAAGGYDWSTPVMLTSNDLAQSTSPAIVVRADGLAVVTYLKRATRSQDDTDLYYSLVNVNTGSLLWSALAPAATEWVEPHAFSGGYDAATGKISFNSDIEKSFDFGSESIGFKAALAVNGGVSGCGATAGGTASLEATTSSAQDSVKINGSVSGNFAWQVNPEECGWEFKSATFDIGGGVHYDMKNAATRILRAIPHPAPKFIAAGLDEMKDFLRSWVTVEDTVGFTAGIGLNGMGWTHAPAPIGSNFRTPDVYGRNTLTLDASITLGVKTRGSKQVVIESLEPVAFSFWHPLEEKKFVHLEGTNDTGVSFAVSGMAKVSTTFQIYPEPHVRNVLVSGEFKISLSPYYSFTYPISASPIADHAVIKPRGGSGSDTLPSGWIFGYDPTAFIGDTNVFGGNSVLGDVGSDLYQDDPPVLAVDSTGVPFQVWSKFGNPYAAQPGGQVYVADFTGTNWTAPQTLPGSLGLNSEVCATTDGEGHRLVVWAHADGSAIATNLTYAEFKAARSAAELVYSIFDGSTWSTPEPVVATPGLDQDLNLSRLDDGNILATWMYSDTSSVQHLMTSIWDGKGWGSVAEITSGPISSPTAQQVAGVTYLFWTEEVTTNHDRSLFTAQNAGAGWSSPALFSPALLAPAPSMVAVSPAIISPRGLLDDVQFVLTDKQRKACCKCDHGVKNVDVNMNEGCGIASVEYNYETCHRIFTYKPCQVRPMDPNNIVGPEGFGPERWVPAGTPLDYTIQFENDPALASAPATRVMITLPLDPHFDPRTFRLGDFGFGGLIFNIPPGQAFYQTRLDLTATKGYFVDLIAGVDVANHQAFWTLATIDPATGDVPRNALIGFLPPNNNPPEGDGFVSCSIAPLAGVTNGSPVAAKATIVFDNQPPMDTPYALNTLQTGAPVSSVQPLPSVTLVPTFDVAWQGAAPAGVASYDIYASENGESFYPWLQGTTLGAAPFVGQPGGTYAFYSIAHDNVGNTQAAPTNADAVTFVSSNLPPVIQTITNVVRPPDSKILMRVCATDPNGDKLTYSLLTAPPGATIRATNGLFSWHPTRAVADTTNYVTVVVTDNGLPPLATNQTFTIVILDFLELSLGETNLEGGQSASLPVSLASNDGVTNLTFNVQVPGDLLTNWSVTATSPQIGSATLQDSATNILVTLNAASGQTLSGSQQISLLNFSAVTNQMSGFITLPITSVNATKPGGGTYENYLTHAGSVILVQNEPLIRALIDTNQVRSLQFYGRLGTDYQVLFNTNLSLSAGWQPLLDYTQTNGVITLPVDSTNPVIFYRLREP